MSHQRPLLVDPLVFKSSHLYPKEPPPPVWKVIWSRLDWSYILCNLIIPFGTLLLLIFILKQRYYNRQKQLKLMNQYQNYWSNN